MASKNIFQQPVFFGLVFLFFSFGKISAQEDYSLAGLDLTLFRDANAIIRQRDLVFEVKPNHETILKVHQVVTLLNKSSQHDKLVLPYDGSSKIRKLSGKIYDSYGKEIRSVSKDEIKDQSAISSSSIYEDRRIKYLDLAIKQLPVTVEFEYEKVSWGELFIENWDIQPYNTAVQSSSYTLITPAGFEVHCKALNIDLTARQETTGGKSIRRWTVQNLPAVRYEPYAPPAMEVLPRLLFAPQTFYFHGYKGSWDNWSAFGTFMSELMAGTSELPTDLKQMVHQQVEGLENPADKVAALYHFLQQNTRYVSVQMDVSGWQPYPVKEVAQKKYGDCKGLSNYMKALLKEAGIEAWPALIWRDNQPNTLPEDFVLPRFNHMLLYLPSENQWLECTSNTYPAGYAGWSNQNRKALLITPEGGKLVHTPPMKPEDNFAHHTTRIQLLDNGQARFVDSVRFGGWQHEWLRYAAHHLTNAEMQEEYLQNSSLPAANLSRFTVDVAAHSPHATVLLEGKFLKYAAKSGKRLFLPVNAVDALTAVPDEVQDRRLPVRSHSAYADADTILIILPKGYKTESAPEPVLLETPYGNYHLEVHQADGSLTIVRSLEVFPVSLPASEYPKWRAFFKDVAKADAAMIVLVQQKT